MAELDSVDGLVSVDEAINRVLAAERTAREAVAGCRQQALDVLEDAREQSLRIEMRAEEKIRATSAISDASIDREIAEIEAETVALTEETELSDDQLTYLDQVIDTLIMELLGAAE